MPNDNVAHYQQETRLETKQFQTETEAGPRYVDDRSWRGSSALRSRQAAASEATEADAATERGDVA